MKGFDDKKIAEEYRDVIEAITKNCPGAEYCIKGDELFVNPPLLTKQFFEHFLLCFLDNKFGFMVNNSSTIIIFKL